MEREGHGVGGAGSLEQYEGYTVYDRDGDKIGKVDDLFVDEHDQIEYIGVKMGLLGLGGSALIPWEAVRVHDEDRRIEASTDKSTVKEGPSYEEGQELTPEYEEQVRSHYGLSGGRQGTAERGGYGDYYRDEGDATSHSGAAAGMPGEERHGGESHREGAERGTEELHDRARDREGMTDEERRFGGREHDREREGATARGAGDEDEIRVQRVEEELEAGTREREAGAMRIQKRVRTDREQLRVPKRREEVSVERVPVEDREASEAEIGEDEVVMPVTEEEVVVQKRPVVKEEVRIRKDAVEDEELVEEDVRKEEIDVDDQIERGGRHGGRGAEDLDDEARRRER